MKTILLTGVTGYIGSHGAVALLEKGYNVIIVDNLLNSSISSLDAIYKITGRKPKFYEIDLRNKIDLEKVFSENKIDSVIHFAGTKAVGESCNITKKVAKKDLKYRIVERRSGDIAISYCSPEKAENFLNWEASFDIEEAIEDSYNFIKNR